MSATVLPLRSNARPPLPSLAAAGNAPGPVPLFEQAGVGIALIQRRRITNCNQRFADLFGFAEPAQALGTVTRDLYVNALGIMAYPVMSAGRPFRIELPQRLPWCSAPWRRPGSALSASKSS